MVEEKKKKKLEHQTNKQCYTIFNALFDIYV